MNDDEKKAIYEALICILTGMKITSSITFDEEFVTTRNNYIDSTIEMLEELKGQGK